MNDHRASRRRFLAACGTTLGVASAGCTLAPMDDGIAASDPDTTTAVDDSAPTVDDPAYANAYQETIQSVVEIRVHQASGASGDGTGFVYDEDHLVTNQHVVAGAESVYVRFHDGGWQRVRVVGTDVYSDLAVLRIDDRAAEATPIPLFEGAPAIGRRVVAIGTPFGLSGSASAGIVSGVDRTLPAANGFSIPVAVQTDAAVNPGNSGGPLVAVDGTSETDGEGNGGQPPVVGVINAGSGDSIGFAISARLIRRVAPALISRGEFAHSYMGVRLTSVTPAIAEANDLERAVGVYIDAVVDGTVSDGVLRGSDGDQQINGTAVPTGGDVIRAMDDQELPTRQALASFLALQTNPGSTVDVSLVRDGEEQTVSLTLGSRPDPE